MAQSEKMFVGRHPLIILTYILKATSRVGKVRHASKASKPFKKSLNKTLNPVSLCIFVMPTAGFGYLTVILHNVCSRKIFATLRTIFTFSRTLFSMRGQKLFVSCQNFSARLESVPIFLHRCIGALSHEGIRRFESHFCVAYPSLH